MDRTATTRRAFLAGLTATVSTPAIAAPDTSLRPRPRPATIADVAPPRSAEVEALFRQANLGGELSFVAADAASGRIIESRLPRLGMPPASTAKAMTAQYALERLGPGFRFHTRLLATGPIRNGTLDGDLVLVGGGDPVLDTDDLGDLAAGLKTAGVSAMTGRFLVAPGAMPETWAIDADQPDHLGYNPAVAGLNLNFNRVHFEWERQGSDYAVTMEARSKRFRPSFDLARMDIVPRSTPIYTYRSDGPIDHWTVARAALGSKGARWLPVRHPVDYTVNVFMSLARSYGIALSKPERVNYVPGGYTVCEHASSDLRTIVRGMLKYSTNLTAEVVGQTATMMGGVVPGDLQGSADEMSRWLAWSAGARRPAFVDHSGLGERTDLATEDMVAGLRRAGPDGRLASLMKPWYFRTTEGGADKGNPIRMVAKTGTLNFVSALAGYILPPERPPVVFAVFTANEERRAAIPREERDRPVGAKSWSRRSRRLQDQLLKRWAVSRTA
ncbi:MAG: D-alanyl-D-alanine carboxypeptidase/D-alanyl-D-alanine-endopeptidase [Pseudomonadota bacterium]